MLLSGSWLRFDRGRGAVVLAGRDRCFPSEHAARHPLASGLGLLPCLGPHLLGYRLSHVNGLSCLGPHFVALENGVADEVVGRDVDKWSAQRSGHGLFGEPARCDELGGLPGEVRVERRFDHGERGMLQPVQDHRTRLPLDAAAQRRRGDEGPQGPSCRWSWYPWRGPSASIEGHAAGTPIGPAGPRDRTPAAYGYKLIKRFVLAR
jgi:hypothetical protein